MNIDILIPTRGRPDRLFDIISSAFDCAYNKDSLKFYIYIDVDDIRTIDSIEWGGWINYNTSCIIHDNQILSKCWNYLYMLGKGTILFHGSDDIIFETQGWDRIVIEHFKNHPETLYYGRDGHQDKNCPTHSFTSRSAADKIGYFVPPYFETDFNDVWLREVYTKANRIFYNPDLMIRHNHVNVNPDLNDSTYELAKERRIRAAKVWEEKKHLIDEDVKKLLA